MIDMSGWANVSECADLPTLDELLAAHEEGRRIRAHYAREIAAMRDVDRREVVR